MRYFVTSENEAFLGVTLKNQVDNYITRYIELVTMVYKSSTIEDHTSKNSWVSWLGYKRLVSIPAPRKKCPPSDVWQITIVYYLDKSWLVVSNFFKIFQNIWDNPSHSHWLSYFSKWLLHHQAESYWNYVHQRSNSTVVIHHSFMTRKKGHLGGFLVVTLW